MLHVQRKYASQAGRVRSFGNASFGIQLFSTLPEDAFDRQPLVEHNILLVADIRLDNRDELTVKLGLDPADTRSLADSQLLSMAWRRWGKDCVSRIFGDFAIAAYSTAEQKLFLIRDPLGRRPLFYARCGRTIAFSSMPTGILTLPGFRRGLDLQGIAAGLLLVGQNDSRTCFQGIRRVMSGEIRTFAGGREDSERFWSPSFEPLLLKSQEDYVEAYRDVLVEAVRPQLRRQSGLIGAHLSSGFDSSAIASTAAMEKAPDEKMIAFTSAPRKEFQAPAPRNRFADESELAALTARMHGMRHVVVRTHSSLLSTIKHLPGLYQTPFWNIINLPWLWATDDLAQHEGVSIMLTGESGNLTIHAGGLGILGDLVSQKQWKRWWREVRLASKRRDIRLRGILFNSFEPQMPRRLVLTLERLFRGVGKLENESFIHRQWLKDPWLVRDLADWRPVSDDSYRTRLEFLTLGDSATYNKGSLARSGIDTRAPLVDRKLVEFSLTLPRDQLFRDGMSRPLARQGLSDRVPKEVLDTAARGYQAADWFEHINRTEILEMVDEIESNSTVREMIDIPRIRRSIDRWPKDGFHRFDVYWPLGGELPMALAAGHFIVQAERWMAGEFE